MFYVFKNNQQWGPYSVEELNGYISAGNFSLDDLVWSADQADWVPISQLPDITAGQNPQASFNAEEEIQASMARQAQRELPILSDTCPKCGHAVEPQQVICITCGSNLEILAQLDTAPDSQESIQHKKYLEKYERFSKNIRSGFVCFIVPAIVIYLGLWAYNDWKPPAPIIPVMIIGLSTLMVLSLLIFKFVCGLILIPRQHRIKLFFYIGLIYGLVITSIIFLPEVIESALEWPDSHEIFRGLLVFMAVPIFIVTPNFVRLGIPRLNGTYSKSWPTDLEANWKVPLGPYQEQIWLDGKLISFKQWSRDQQRIPLEKYGYRIDGATDAPRTTMPLIYRIYLDPYRRWWIWEFTKGVTVGLIRKILFGV